MSHYVEVSVEKPGNLPCGHTAVELEQNDTGYLTADTPGVAGVFPHLASLKIAMIK